MKVPAAAAALAVVGVLLAGCGGDDSAEAGAPASCELTNPPTKTEGKLVVATGEPAFSPWVENDDPASGEGFEAALVYAIAAEMGLDKAAVSWVRTGFDEAIAPGGKDFDFNVQQYSISEERAKVVDFSAPYYGVEQAIVARADGPLVGAASLADLKDAKLGAAVGTTSLDYIDEVIKPATKAAVFDDNAAAKASFDAKQVDGIVFDLPTAYYITAVEIPDSTIVGVLPQAGAEPEQLGALFEKGSPLVGCVDEAIAALEADGTLAKLQETWLNQGGDIPTLTK